MQTIPVRIAGQPDPLDRSQPFAEERDRDHDRDRRAERRRQPDHPRRRRFEAGREGDEPDDVEAAGEHEGPDDPTVRPARAVRSAGGRSTCDVRARISTAAVPIEALMTRAIV